jgi:hypothetical protein
VTVALVHLAVRDRRTFRELHRTALAKVAVRLYAEHLTLLATDPDPYVITSEHVAEDFTGWAWAELGAQPLRVTALREHESARPGSARHWGVLAAQRGTLIDRLADDDALRALLVDPSITHITADAWGRFSGVAHVYERAYYKARVNWQLVGVHAGRRITQRRYLEA